MSHISDELRETCSMDHMPWPFDAQAKKLIEKWFKQSSPNYPPKSVGQDLYKLLFSPKLREFFKSTITNSLQNTETLIKVKINDNPLLNMIPFEILHDGKNFIFSSNRVVIRYVYNNDKISPKTQNLKRILVVLAEPIDLASWGLDNTKKEIEESLAPWDFKIIPHAGPNEVIEELSQTAVNNPYDAIFVIAHGEPPSANTDGYLLLEEDGTKRSTPFTSTSFSSVISGHQGCFVFLCSCSSGKVIKTNPLASIGHQLIYNGAAGSVLAMQKPIEARVGIELFSLFINSLKTHRDIYQGYKYCMTNYLSTPNHGIPCLYSRQIKSQNNVKSIEDPTYVLEANLISSVFCLDKRNSRVAIILPGFRMGMKQEDYQQIPVEQWTPITKDRYKYAGLTSSKCDINASKGIMMLLGKVFDLDDLDGRVIVDTDDNTNNLLTDSSITHFIFLGSRSHAFSRSILSQYSEDFIFDYSEEVWKLSDKRTNKNYIVKNPSKIESGVKNKTDCGLDYAIIEKIVDEISKRVIIVIAGMWDTSTLAAGKYLSSNIDKFYKTYGMGGFQLLLELQAGSSRISRVVEERRPRRN